MLFDDFSIHIRAYFTKANAAVKANDAALGRPKQGTAPSGGSVVREATSVGVI
jgi:hypothetical protein